MRLFRPLEVFSVDGLNAGVVGQELVPGGETVACARQYVGGVRRELGTERAGYCEENDGAHTLSIRPE
jgi:hypothetical protein